MSNVMNIENLNVLIENLMNKDVVKLNSNSIQNNIQITLKNGKVFDINILNGSVECNWFGLDIFSYKDVTNNEEYPYYKTYLNAECDGVRTTKKEITDKFISFLLMSEQYGKVSLTIYYNDNIEFSIVEQNSANVIKL